MTVVSVLHLSLQIVRVQSKNGTKRINTLPTDTLQNFLEKVPVVIVHKLNCEATSLSMPHPLPRP